MSLPLVELVVGNLKEGVTTAHPSFNELRDAYAVGGFTRQSYGVTLENPRKLYWIIHCETTTPKDFLAEWPVQVCDYRQEIDEIMTEEPVRYAMPRDSCTKVFSAETTNAPVTEIAIAEPKNVDELEKYEKVLQSVVDAPATEPTAHGGWHSMTKTEKCVWTSIILVGWDSVEAHNAAQARHAALLQSVHNIATLMSLEHVSMTDHI